MKVASAPVSPTAPAPRWLLYVILALGFVIAVCFALKTPTDIVGPPARPGWNPDESSHIDYIRLLVETGGLVKFTPGDPAYFETHQPPLYYLLCAPVFALTGRSLFAIRLVAAVIQLGTIALAWRAARTLFPSRPEAAPAAAAFVAFLPTQAQLAGAVNNDGLITLLCTAILWRVGLLVRRGNTGSVKENLLVGVLIGLGLLTKLSVLQLLPAVAVGYYLAGRRSNLQTRTGAGTLSLPVAFVVAIATGFIVASPWLIRNTMLYGDPFTLKIFPLTAGPDPATPMKMMPQMGWSTIDYWRTVGTRSFETFWHILYPYVLQPTAPIFVLTLLLAIGGVIGAFRGADRGGLADAGERRVIVFLATALALLVPFFVRFNMQFFQAQGRYFLPALLSAALLCVIGWGTVAGEARRSLALGVIVFLVFALCLYQLSLFV